MNPTVRVYKSIDFVKLQTFISVGLKLVRLHSFLTYRMIEQKTNQKQMLENNYMLLRNHCGRKSLLDLTIPYLLTLLGFILIYQ